MTDKFENGYMPTYYEIFRQLESETAFDDNGAFTVIELGVRDGSSLTLWRHLAPVDTCVLGVDIDPTATWPPRTHGLVCDQTSAQILTYVTEHHLPPVCLVVDDASHMGTLTWRSFEMLWPLVRPGGFYVIEDWGVCFAGRAPIYEPGMMAIAQEMPNLFSPRSPYGRVEEVTLRDGLIVIKKGR